MSPDSHMKLPPRYAQLGIGASLLKVLQVLHRWKIIAKTSNSKLLNIIIVFSVYLTEIDKTAKPCENVSKN